MKVFKMGISCSFPKRFCLAINVIYIQHKTTNRQIARLDCFRESKPLCLFTHSVAKIKSMAVTQEMNTKQKNMTFQKYWLKKLHWKSENRSKPSGHPQPSSRGTQLDKLRTRTDHCKSEITVYLYKTNLHKIAPPAHSNTPEGLFSLPSP